MDDLPEPQLPCRATTRLSFPCQLEIALAKFAEKFARPNKSSSTLRIGLSEENSCVFFDSMYYL